MIPKIIHQIWFQGEDKIPDKYHKNIELIKNHYKTWTYILWTDESIKQILNDKELKLYNGYKYMHQKIDFSKYVILYKYGGMYIDIDAKSLKPIDPLLEQYKDKDLIISKINSNYIENLVGCNALECYNNGIIISSKNDFILKKMIERCLETRNHYLDFNKMNSINYTTGPGMLTKVINKYKNDKIILLDSKYLEPCNYTLCNVTNDTYIKHEHELSWLNSFFKFLFDLYFNNKILCYIIVIILLYSIINFFIKKNKKK